MKQSFSTKISVFKSLFEVKDVPFDLTLADVYTRIKNGNDLLISKIDKIRTSTNKEEIAATKKTLTAIMFNGTFIARNDQSLKEHSGCCILDYDKYPTPEDMEDERRRLMADPYTLMLFISPGGNGLKQLIRIPKVIKTSINAGLKPIRPILSRHILMKKTVIFRGYALKALILASI